MNNLENMKTELLGLPVIKGEKHHLEAFAKDCEIFGHDVYINSNPEILVYNNSDFRQIITSEQSFKTLFVGPSRSSGYNNHNLPVQNFQLPQDWSVALEFMKENMDRWKKIQEENKQPEFKVGDYVVILDTGFMFDSSNTRCKDVKQISFMGKHDTIQPTRNIILFTDNSSGQNEYFQDRHYRKATPQEIEEYLNKPKIFKMTSSSGDFELEVSKKGIYYRPEQRWLSPNFLWEFTDTNCRLPMGAGTGYLVSVTKVDVGCKKDTLVSQWQKVYSYYRSLQ